MFGVCGQNRWFMVKARELVSYSRKYTSKHVITPIAPESDRNQHLRSRIEHPKKRIAQKT